MLNFIKEYKNNLAMESRLPRVQMISNKIYYWLYKMKAERYGCLNGYVPEDNVITAINEKAVRQKANCKQNKSLSDSRFVLFDTETTGFYPYRGDEVINLAGVVVEDGKVRENLVFDELVNPFKPIPVIIQKLTGINDKMVADKGDILSVLSDFLDFAGDSVLVAHNADFDLAFINIKLKWFARTEIYNPVVDVERLARVLYPKFLSYDLDNLIKNLNITPKPRHKALGDALMTAEIFIHFLEMLQEINIDTLNELNCFLNRKYLTLHRY